MKLEDIGYNSKIERLRIENNLNDFEIGRVGPNTKKDMLLKMRLENLKLK